MLSEGVRIDDNCLSNVINQFDDDLSMEHKDLLYKLNSRDLFPKVGIYLILPIYFSCLIICAINYIAYTKDEDK